MFSALAVLHEATMAWNLLALTTPLMRRHLYPLMRDPFDMNRIRD